MNFSVLMSVYFKDNPIHLKQAFDSIENQTLPPNQIVLVEDGPLTEEIYRLIDEFSSKLIPVRRVVLNSNVGLGKALSIGLLHCENDLVARCDSDDINLLNRFEQQINYFIAHPEVSIIGGQIREFYTVDKEQYFTSERNVPIDYENIKLFSKKRNPLNHMTVMFKKEHILLSGNYKTVIGMEDYYLWLRVLKRGYIVKNMPQTLVNVRIDNGMINRRGGVSYVIQSLKNKKLFFMEGLIDFKSFIISSVASVLIGLSPTFIRKVAYQKILHRKK